MRLSPPLKVTGIISFRQSLLTTERSVEVNANTCSEDRLLYNAIGNRLMKKAKKDFRILHLNIGALTVVEREGNKVAKICELIRTTQADTMVFGEHGINPRALPRHEQ